MQIFLDFTNFYCWFIDHYFKIAVLLTGLLKGSVKSKKTELFEFPLITKKAFNELQKAFCSASVLKYFNSALPIWLETDASGFAFVSIFSQLFKNMDRNDINWHLIAFWSQKMIDVKICYIIHDGELLIIIMFFKHWCHYLNGSQHSIKVFMNHNNLQYFMGKIKLNGHQSQWFIILALYDFVIAHWFSTYNSVNEPFCQPDYE